MYIFTTNELFNLEFLAQNIKTDQFQMITLHNRPLTKHMITTRKNPNNNDSLYHNIRNTIRRPVQATRV
jgi:hypothetical protein